MPSDQQLFAKGLATYQKIVAANYMGHRDVYDLLHVVLMEEAPSNFVFVDLGCGTAAGSAAALVGTRVARYVGIDISQPSLDIAKEALSRLSCPVDLRRQDFVAAIDHWTGPLDVVWIGQSLHHLRTEDKKAFMRMVESLLAPEGLFLIWEPTCLEGEDREAWMGPFLSDATAMVDVYRRGIRGRRQPQSRLRFSRDDIDLDRNGPRRRFREGGRILVGSQSNDPRLSLPPLGSLIKIENDGGS